MFCDLEISEIRELKIKNIAQERRIPLMLKSVP